MPLSIGKNIGRKRICMIIRSPIFTSTKGGAELRVRPTIQGWVMIHLCGQEQYCQKEVLYKLQSHNKGIQLTYHPTSVWVHTLKIWVFFYIVSQFFCFLPFFSFLHKKSL